MRNVETLPKDLPVPRDDGLTSHLEGAEMPRIILQTTSGEMLALNEISLSPTVLFIYPRAGSPVPLQITTFEDHQVISST